MHVFVSKFWHDMNIFLEILEKTFLRKAHGKETRNRKQEKWNLQRLFDLHKQLIINLQNNVNSTIKISVFLDDKESKCTFKQYRMSSLSSIENARFSRTRLMKYIIFWIEKNGHHEIMHLDKLKATCDAGKGAFNNVFYSNICVTNLWGCIIELLIWPFNCCPEGRIKSNVQKYKIFHAFRRTKKQRAQFNSSFQ